MIISGSIKANNRFLPKGASGEIWAEICSVPVGGHIYVCVLGRGDDKIINSACPDHTGVKEDTQDTVPFDVADDFDRHDPQDFAYKVDVDTSMGQREGGSYIRFGMTYNDKQWQSTDRLKLLETDVPGLCLHFEEVS